MAENLRRPPGGSPAFSFGAKSHKRFLVVCDLLKYYKTVGRDVTAGNIKWNRVMRNFDIQWKALQERSKNDETPDVPKISKALPIIKWTESFHDFLGQVIGVRTIPLTYVVRGQVEVAMPAPPLMTNQPHSFEHGSVELELVNRASYDHPLFRDDNSKLYYLLEEATRSTQYAALIKPFQRRKDGRGAWLALIGTVFWPGQVGSRDLETRAAPPHSQVEGTIELLSGTICVQPQERLCFDNGVC